ncbi:MAG: S9 family peptidase [Armatimonadetes bacterium]|nr:S9 family peptidase [Armatimonadota bacterium]
MTFDAPKATFSCGTWPSPIMPEMLAGAAVGLSQPAIDGDDLYWVESRPAEAGRNVIVRRERSGAVTDVLPAGFDARSRVHEYGGGAYAARAGHVVFSNAADGRLYQITPGGPPRPLTPEGPFRYADLVLDAPRARLLCVREDHTAATSAPRNEVIAVDLHGSVPPTVLLGGHDFYAAPRLSPDGTRLAWLSWDQPDMPWDATALSVARLGPNGTPLALTVIAGGRDESIFQPEWSPSGDLWYVSDRSGWWNLYRVPATGGAPTPMLPMEAEFGRPQWAFALTTYGFASPQRVVCAYVRDGVWHLGALDLTEGGLSPFPADLCAISDLRVGDGRAVVVGASLSTPPSIVEVDAHTGESLIRKRSSEISVTAGDRSEPRHIAYASHGGARGYTFYYPPCNAAFTGYPGEKPPLIVRGHGGPTASASPGLNFEIQFWTSRGFAVADVNYTGSTGYGRAYRNRLDGAWGVADVEDFAAAAQHLAAAGLADERRLIVRGSSAAGFTALCALVAHDVFAAGGVYYGVSDLAALADDTHKFEARYLDRLVGPYPRCADLYRARSPLFQAGRIRCPIIFFQGLDDRVVPPAQTTAMADALRANGIPVEVHLYPGESHGFRRAETIRAALDAELAFYRRALAITRTVPR